MLTKHCNKQKYFGDLTLTLWRVNAVKKRSEDLKLFEFLKICPSRPDGTTHYLTFLPLFYFISMLLF